jgi:hypothetical protein
MKNLTVFLVIVISLFAISCEKKDEIKPEPQREYAEYKVVVFSNDDAVSSAYFTVNCVPMIDNLDSRPMKKEGNMFYFYFPLKLEVYEGQLVKIDISVIYRDEQGDISDRYETYKTITIEDTGEFQNIEFTVP